MMRSFERLTYPLNGLGYGKTSGILFLRTKHGMLTCVYISRSIHTSEDVYQVRMYEYVIVRSNVSIYGPRKLTASCWSLKPALVLKKNKVLQTTSHSQSIWGLKYNGRKREKNKTIGINNFRNLFSKIRINFYVNFKNRIFSKFIFFKNLKAPKSSRIVYA